MSSFLNDHMKVLNNAIDIIERATRDQYPNEKEYEDRSKYIKDLDNWRKRSRMIEMMLEYVAREAERNYRKKDNLKNQNLIKQALDVAGYDMEPTEENLIECFTDYVDAGRWINLTLDDIDNLTVSEMARALINLKG